MTNRNSVASRLAHRGRSLLPLLAAMLLGSVLAASTALAQAPSLPFDVGERAEYTVRFGAIRAGSAFTEVVGRDTVRGRDVLHLQFGLRGGIPFFRVNDLFESWIDPLTLASLRHSQKISEGRYKRDRHFEIVPEAGHYIANARDTLPTVADPLDDTSFLYFIRTVPLDSGATYVFGRYFRPDRNPVTIRVLRRERVRVEAGEFDAVVIQPIINTRGIFSEGGRAEIWLSDDPRRIMLQMKSKLSFGSINLELRSYRPASASAPAPDVPPSR